MKHTSKLVSKMAIPLFSTLLDKYYIFLPDLSCHFYKINNCTDSIIIYFWNFCFLMLAFQFTNNSAHCVLIFKAYIYMEVAVSSLFLFYLRFSQVLLSLMNYRLERTKIVFYWDLIKHKITR